MIRHLSAATTLAAILAVANPHGAEAGWKRTTLVPNVPGGLATVGLADNGQALTQFAPGGAFDNISAWAAPNYFSSFGYCGNSARTDAEGFDNLGNDVGTCFPDLGEAYGYIHLADGSVTGIGYPGAVGTVVTGVEQGTLVTGYYWNNAQNPQYFGFLYNPFNGGVGAITPPGAVNTFVRGINNSGDVWGSYTDANNTTHGFATLFNQMYEINPPGFRSADVSSVSTVGIGILSGTAYDFNSVAHAFAYVNGNYIFPPLGKVATSHAYGITSNDLVVGDYTTTGGVRFGFRWNANANTVSLIKAPAGSTDFELNSINASGEVAGFYYMNGVAIAFVATCNAQSCK